MARPFQGLAEGAYRVTIAVNDGIGEADRVANVSHRRVRCHAHPMTAFLSVNQSLLWGLGPEP
jgi:hypothetical protein